MAKKSKHEPHPLLKVLPVMDLEDMAKGAYYAAKYHFGKIQELLRGPAFTTYWGMDPTNIDEATKRQMQRQINIFYYHIRAYFWELVASFDTMLMWANYRYGLNVPEYRVTWDIISTSSPQVDGNEWGEKKKHLENVWGEEWYFEVRLYRNFAHRASLFGLSEYDYNHETQESTFAAFRLTPARVGQQQYELEAQLLLYLHQMRTLLEAVYPFTKDKS